MWVKNKKTMINKVIIDKVFCGLDIGSHSIKAGLIKVKNTDDIELLGFYERKTQGFKNGSVHDLNDLTECIQLTLNELMKKTGVKFKNVYLGVSGDMVDIRNVNTEIPLIDKGSKIIVSRDIKKVNKQARLLSLKMEEEILHELPKLYEIDELSSAINPIGLCGRKLGINSSMVVMHASRISNLTIAVQKAGFDVANVFYTTLVASSVLFDEKTKKDGCVLVDFGASVTNVLIFKDGVIRRMGSLKIGGNDLSVAIASAIHVTFELAEEIKKSYAQALVIDYSSEEEILVKKDAQYIPIKKVDIFRAIEPGLNQMIEFIDLEIKSSQILNESGCSINMIGGGSLLSGIMDRLFEKSSIPVNQGLTVGQYKKGMSHSPKYFSALGLAQNGYKNTISYAFSRNGQKDWVQLFVGRINELYHEYF